MTSPTPKKSLTDDQRLAIYHSLLASSDNGKLKHGSLTGVAKQFGVSAQTVRRVWRRGQSSVAKGAVVADVRARTKGNSGRKGYDKEELQRAIDKVPKEKQASFRQLEEATGVSKSVLHKAIKTGKITLTGKISLKPAKE